MQADPKKGRISVRLSSDPSGGTPGLHTVPPQGGRAAQLFVPASYDAEKGAPLVVSLHGATRDASRGLALLQAQSEKEGFLLLAPASRRQTWDVIIDGFGSDVTAIQSAVQWVAERYRIRKDRVAIGGFSDGASYALCLGITNGDLFTHVLAFSPGFFRTLEWNGWPKMYISHGTADRILPIDSCSRRLVPQLKKAGYDVTYKEFEGPHTVPEECRNEAISLFLGKG